MSDFGILTQEFGEIAAGHKAFYLWDHGWGTHRTTTIPLQSEAAFWFDFPQIPDNEAVVMFIGVENNNARSLARPIMTTGSSAIASYTSQGIDRPYFYIFSTAKNPNMSLNKDYGLQIFDDKGSMAYDSNYPTLKPLFSTMYNRFGTIDAYDIGVREVAISTSCVNGYIYGLQSGQFGQVGGVFIRRVGNKLVSEGKLVGGMRIHYSDVEFFNFMSSNYGSQTAPSGYNYLLNIADVSDIVKKPK